MSAIGPGDWVEAITDRVHYDGFAISVGSLYRISSAWPQHRMNRVCDDCNQPNGGLSLVGHSEDLAWCPCHFKPISGGERGMFDHMLKLDAPSKEPVAA